MNDHIPLEDLSAHIDGELDPARAAEVDAHLAQCDACRAERASLAATVGALRALPLAEPPPGTSFRVPGAAGTGAARRGGPPWGWLALGGLAAMLVLMIGLGRRLGPGGAGPGSAEDWAGATGLPADPAPGTPQLDLVSASDAAGGLVRAGDDALTRTPPLATAMAADRLRQVAVDEGAPPRAAGTAQAAGDRGGYAPPDRPIPGVGDGRVAALAPATLERTPDAIGGGPLSTATAGGPLSTATAGVPASPTAVVTATGPVVDAAATAPASAGDTPTPAAAPPTSVEPPGPAASSGEGMAGGESVGVLPRGLAVSLSVLSLGLLAFGAVLLRRARARSRRRAWRRD